MFSLTKEENPFMLDGEPVLGNIDSEVAYNQCKAFEIGAMRQLRKISKDRQAQCSDECQRNSYMSKCEACWRDWFHDLKAEAGCE